MPSILTVTLNPAVDKSTFVNSLKPGKKLRCATPVLQPGGGGINVARAIQKLGGRADAVFMAGGYTGDLLKKLLDYESVTYHVTPLKNDTRENIAIVDRSTNLQYRFVMPGPEVYEEEWQKCLEVIATFNGLEYIIVSGSIPSGVPDDICARIAALAKKKQVKCIVDTTIESLKLALAEGVYLIKPNLDELCQLAGVKELNGKAVEDAARDIITRTACSVIVVSMGDAGALLVTKDLIQQIPTPYVEVKSSVGAGDSMVAGIVHSLLNGKTILDAVQYGVACGTASTVNEGTGLCNLQDVEDIYANIRQQHLEGIFQ